MSVGGSDGLTNDWADTVNELVARDRSVSPISRAVRSTRKKLADVEGANATEQRAATADSSNQSCQETIIPETSEEQDSPPGEEIGAQAHKADSSPLRTTEKPKECETEPQGEDKVANQNMTSDQEGSSSPPNVTTRLEDSIDAIDALEDAIEQVDREMPSLPILGTSDAAHKSSTPSKVSAATSGKIAKAPAAKPSVAKRQVKVGENNGVRKGSSIKPVIKPKEAAPAQKPVPQRSQSTRKPSNAPTSTAQKAEEPKSGRATSNAVDYLAMKRRPISVSLARPPTPPKPRKPSTTPTFQLPGEAIAAKAKALREERLKQEAEAQAAKRQFKARAVPKSSAPGAAIVVKATAASRARESLMKGIQEEPAKEQQLAKPDQSKRMSSAISAIDRRRMSAAITHKRASSVSVHPAAKATQPGGPGSKRTPSVSTLTSRPVSMGSPKPGSNTGSVTKSTVPLTDAATQRNKGREVFNRDRIEKQEREQERKQKEEAAKKARAEAAVRGRQASREWAERQKQKSMGKGKVTPPQKDGQLEQTPTCEEGNTGAATEVAVIQQ